MAVVSDYTALLSGSSVGGSVGKGAFVSFSFPTSVPAYYAGVYPAAGLASFQPFSEQAKAAARTAINAWAAVSGLTAFEVAPGDGDIKFMAFDLAKLNSSAAGFAYYPASGGQSDIASDIFIGLPHTSNQRILLHEVGHALGFKHPHEGATTLDPSVDNLATTVLTYNFTGAPGTVLGTLDVQAAAYLYGNANADGTQVAAWAWDAASQTLTQVGRDTDETLTGIGGNNILSGEGGNDTLTGRNSDRFYGGAGNDTFRVLVERDVLPFLDGGAGTDTANVRFTGDFNRTLNGAVLGSGSIETLVLETGGGQDRITLDTAFTSATVNSGAGNDQILLSAAFGSLNVNASDGTDIIDARLATGSANLNGGAGDDTIFAGPGFAFLYGGAGADRFVWQDAAASGGGGGNRVDQIEDFQSGVDLIDLTGLSATNLRIQASGSSNFIYATSGTQQFTLFVRQAVSLSDIAYDPRTGTHRDDILTNTVASERFDGGAGYDMVAFSGVFKQSRLSYAAGTFTVSGPLGVDTLKAVEEFRFADGKYISSADSAGAQVMRLYDAAFGRGVDAPSLDFWLDLMEDQGASFGFVVSAIAASPEFQMATAGLSNQGFVNFIYQRALGRVADATGLAFWTTALDQGNTRAAILASFSESPENRVQTADVVGRGYFNTDDVAQTVSLLYDGLANRLPDAGGLIFWTNLLKSGTMSLAQVGDAFAASPEFVNATQGLSNRQLVDYMYFNTLDRIAEPAGSNYWTGQLDRGMTRGELLLGFSLSPEHSLLHASHIIGGIDVLM